MKATGIVRNLDELGRIVLPIELRRTLDIDKSPIEIFLDDDGSIILRKYNPCCVFCGESANVSNFKGKMVCRSCKMELSR